MLDKLFLQILNMSFTASFVILLVVLARFLLKKAPKVISYALWSVVLFRLICPFSFESVISILPTKANPIPSDIMYAQTPQIDTGIPLINNSVNAVLPPAVPYASINPMQVWIFVGSLVWLIGIVALLIYSVVSLLKLQKSLRCAVHEKDNIYISSSISSPFVMGLFRPKIYLPSNIMAEEKSYILLHEQTHIKRFDHAVKLLSFFVLCLHWFNPLVWVAFFLFGRDMEMSCDESVIKKLGNDAKKDYSTSLLSLATGRRIVGGTPLAFGEGDTKSRIKNVLNYKKPAFWVIVVSIVAVVAVGIGLLANPKSGTNSKFGGSAKDIYIRYILALSASDITGMRQLTPALNPPSKDIIDAWRQIKIESIELISEDIREDKAMFKLSVTVKEAPDGLVMWTPGTATHYLRAERCGEGWYVESYGAGVDSPSDLTAWWNRPNLIGGTAAAGSAGEIAIAYTDEYKLFEGKPGGDGNRLLGLVDKNHRVVLPAIYDEISISENGMFITSIIKGDQIYYQVLKPDGTQVGADYSFIESVSPGEDGIQFYRHASFKDMAAVPPYIAYIQAGEDKRDYWLLDENGVPYDAEPYDYIEIYDDSIVQVRDGIAYSKAADGTVTQSGNEVVQTYFGGKYYAKNYYKGANGASLSLWDSNDKQIASPEYCKIEVPFENRYILYKGNNQFLGGAQAFLYDDANKLLASNSNQLSFIFGVDGGYIGTSYVRNSYDDYVEAEILDKDGNPEPQGAYFIDKNGKRLSERYTYIEMFENEAMLLEAAKVADGNSYILSRLGGTLGLKNIVDAAKSGATEKDEAFFIVCTVDNEFRKLPLKDLLIQS